jgi:penicillin amidase
MPLTSKETLQRLGRGEKVADVCTAAGWSRAEFDSWWLAECERRVSPTVGELRVPQLREPASIERDQRGLPHVVAENDTDLFVAYGYAVAQDRLFQLDYLRRKAQGCLAEVIGPEAIDTDVLNRTIGLSRIAEAEWRALPDESRELLTAYTTGINAFMDACEDCLPIEFDLLDYRPRAWRPVDSLAILGEFRAYLTIRFPVLLIPELVKQTLGDGPLYRDFIIGEADEESVLHRGEYPVGTPQNVGQVGGDEGGGSNNWVLAGSRAVSGKPLVASDPHIPFYAVSIWHEVHLRGGSFHVAGVALSGVPGVMIGRNERVAWGITNNLCSQRELYVEKTSPEHPGCFLDDGVWKPDIERRETIRVRGQADVVKTIRSSHNGPIVTDLIPEPARHLGPISLRWIGAEPCGWVTALLDTNRARNVKEFREATRPWVCPTFNLVFADVEGGIGHQCVGRIPIRIIPERGVRPGWESAHQWQGAIPFDQMPSLLNPARGFIISANNRTAPPDFPYDLAGVWSAGWRAKRIRSWLESTPSSDAGASRDFQLDVLSLRAQTAMPHLIRHLASSADALEVAAVAALKSWDCRIDAASAGAAIFNVFFTHWCKTVCEERLGATNAGICSGLAGGIALRLLAGDAHGWFHKQDRSAAIRSSFTSAIHDIASRLGKDIASWSWGRLHMLKQPHFLSTRGDLGKLFDLSGTPAHGDGVTVNSGTPDANFAAWLGAGYRMVADLSDPQFGYWSVESASASGQPGSPHYNDQLGAWSGGQYYYVGLKKGGETIASLRLSPKFT